MEINKEYNAGVGGNESVTKWGDVGQHEKEKLLKPQNEFFVYNNTSRSALFTFYPSSLPSYFLSICIPGNICELPVNTYIINSHVVYANPQVKADIMPNLSNGGNLKTPMPPNLTPT